MEAFTIGGGTWNLEPNTQRMQWDQEQSLINYLAFGSPFPMNRTVAQPRHKGKALILPQGGEVTEFVDFPREGLPSLRSKWRI